MCRLLRYVTRRLFLRRRLRPRITSFSSSLLIAITFPGAMVAARCGGETRLQNAKGGRFPRMMIGVVRGHLVNYGTHTHGGIPQILHNLASYRAAKLSSAHPCILGYEPDMQFAKYGCPNGVQIVKSASQLSLGRTRAVP